VQIVINTDLTAAGTKITCDGECLTDCCKVTAINFYAYAPCGDMEDCGNVGVSVSTIKDDGTSENKTYSMSGSYMEDRKGIGQSESGSEADIEDSEKNYKNFLGKSDEKRDKLISKILDHCSTNKIICPDKDTLNRRAIRSLKDKATDLGLDIKDCE
jgi:hypothetical protein